MTTWTLVGLHDNNENMKTNRRFRLLHISFFQVAPRQMSWTMCPPRHLKTALLLIHCQNLSIPKTVVRVVLHENQVAPWKKYPLPSIMCPSPISWIYWFRRRFFWFLRNSFYSQHNSLDSQHSSVDDNFGGNVYGSVHGNIWGNMYGNIWGNVYGNVWGNIGGNSQKNPLGCRGKGSQYLHVSWETRATIIHSDSRIKLHLNTKGLHAFMTQSVKNIDSRMATKSTLRSVCQVYTKYVHPHTSFVWPTTKFFSKKALLLIHCQNLPIPKSIPPIPKPPVVSDVTQT